MAQSCEKGLGSSWYGILASGRRGGACAERDLRQTDAPPEPIPVGAAGASQGKPPGPCSLRLSPHSGVSSGGDNYPTQGAFVDYLASMDATDKALFDELPPAIASTGTSVAGRPAPDARPVGNGGALEARTGALGHRRRARQARVHGGQRGADLEALRTRCARRVPAGKRARGAAIYLAF